MAPPQLSIVGYEPPKIDPPTPVAPLSIVKAEPFGPRVPVDVPDEPRYTSAVRVTDPLDLPAPPPPPTLFALRPPAPVRVPESLAITSGPITPRPAPIQVDRQDTRDVRVTEPGGGVDKSTWDARADGSQKGTGFLGVLKRADGKVSSEISIGVEIDGSQLEIPTMVPTLAPSEVQWLLTHDVSNPRNIPAPIVDKAVAFARTRLAEGKSPFASDAETPPPAPPPKTWLERLGSVGDPEAAYGEIAAASGYPQLPAEGVKQIVKGVKVMGEQLAHPVVRGPEYPQVIHADDPERNEAALNAMADVLEGAGKAASPMVLAGAMINLPATGATLLASWAAATAAGKGAEWAGASPGAQRFAAAAAGATMALAGADYIAKGERVGRAAVKGAQEQLAFEARVKADAAYREKIAALPDLREVAAKLAQDQSEITARLATQGAPRTVDFSNLVTPAERAVISGMTDEGLTSELQRARLQYAEQTTVGGGPKSATLGRLQVLEDVWTARRAQGPAAGTTGTAPSPVEPPPTQTQPPAPPTAAPPTTLRDLSPTTTVVEPTVTPPVVDVAPPAPTGPAVTVLNPIQPGGPHATQVGQQPQGDLGEHPQGSVGGQTAEAGGGDRAVEQPAAPVVPPQVTYFRSGIASAPADFDGFAKAGVPIGITARNISPEITDRSIDYVKNGGQLFVDSGAIKELTSGGKEVPNFDAVLGYYNHLADSVGPERAQGLYVVAPDKVGDPDATKARQTQYAQPIRDLMARGVNVILPVQKSDTESLTDQMVWAQNNVLAGKVGNDVIWGIPFGKKVYSAEQVAEGLKAFQANMPADAPLKIHLLGMGERNARFEQSIATIRAAVPNVEIHADSSRAQAMFGEGRSTQSRYDQIRKDLQLHYAFWSEKRHANEGVLLDALFEGDLSIFTKDEIAQIAHAARVKPFEVQRAAESPEAWKAFVETWDKSAAPSHAGMTDEEYQDSLDEIIEKIALARADKVAGPEARRAAIAENETPPAPLVPTETERATLQAASDSDLKLLAAHGNVRNRELATAEIARRQQGAAAPAPAAGEPTRYNPLTFKETAPTRMMGVSVEPIHVQVVDGVAYELYRAGKEGVIRVVDVDSGRVVTIVKHPLYQSASAAHYEAISNAERAAKPAAPPPAAQAPDAQAIITAWSQLDHPPQTDAGLASAVPADQPAPFYEPLVAHYRGMLQRSAQKSRDKTIDKDERKRWERIAEAWKETYERAKRGINYESHPGHPATKRRAAEARGNDALTDAEWERLDKLQRRDHAGDDLDEDESHELMELEERVRVAMGEEEEVPPSDVDPNDLVKKPSAEIFPAPKATVLAQNDLVGAVIAPKQGNKLVASWIAEAARMGREEDHSNDVVISLFDRTGVWSQPYVDAGFHVVRIEITNGRDLLKNFPIAEITDLRAAGKRIVGVLAAPPCTSFAGSGARWWEDQHDKADEQMVEKKYGYFAAKYFDTPLEYAKTLVHATHFVIELANPEWFHALENPVGRIEEATDLPKPLLTFHPHHFGDPYTKKTLMWGAFNPQLPTANVEPTWGSFMHVLRGDDPVEKLERSITPEGFAYAFFMANHAPPSRQPAQAEPPAEPKPAAETAPTTETGPHGAPVTPPALLAQALKVNEAATLVAAPGGKNFQPLSAGQRHAMMLNLKNATSAPGITRSAWYVVESVKEPGRTPKREGEIRIAIRTYDTKTGQPHKAEPDVYRLKVPAGFTLEAEAAAAPGPAALTYQQRARLAQAIMQAAGRPNDRGYREELDKLTDEQLQAQAAAPAPKPAEAPPPAAPPAAGGSYVVEVKPVGEGFGARNNLRFATKEDAERYGRDLLDRWSGAEDFRVVESPEPVNRQWNADEGRFEQLPPAGAGPTIEGEPTSEQPAVPARDLAGGGPPGAREPGEPAGGDGGAGTAGVAGEQPPTEPGVPRKPSQRAGNRKRGEGSGVPGVADVTPVPGAGDEPGGGGGAVDASHVDTADVAPTDDEADAHARGEAARWFSITDAGTLTEGGWVSKLDDNLAALRLLKQLTRENRPASDAEQAVLARYIGWGHTELSKVVELRGGEYIRDPRQKQARQELEQLLTKAELKELGESTANAHYSFVDLPRAMWALVQQLGFKGGSILEPAVGTGHFLGTMPGEIRTHRKTSIYGVDKEPIAAAIAQQLYQGAHIQASPLEEAVLPHNYFDLIISNVPFGRIGIFDPAFVSAERTPMTRSVHNYYFAKAIDLARPGGLMVFVTSRQTLDSKTDTHRTYLDRYAHFLGAFRLPDQAFQKTAGTAVVTDVLIFQKRGEGITAPSIPWIDSDERKDLGKVWDEDAGIETYARTNVYYQGRKAQILGKEARSGKMNQRDNEYNVEGSVTPDQLAKAIARLPSNVYVPSKAAPRKVATPAQKDAKQGSFVVEGGKLYTYDQGTLEPSTLTGKSLARAKSFVPLRDAYLAVIEAQMTVASDEALEKAQAALRRQYDAFVKAHGDLNTQENKRVITADPNASRILALENIDVVKEKGKRATVRVTGRADIFTKRLMRPPAEPTSAATASDALLQSVRWKGFVDLPFMESLTGKPAAVLTSELAGEIFDDPATQAWVTRDDYLSGDVVTKLQQAEAAAQATPRYAEHVTALRSVQPERLTIEHFTGDKESGARQAPFGATWVPVELIQRFLHETGGAGATVTLLNSPTKVRWYVEGYGKSEFLPSHYSYTKWVEEGLNGEVPTIKTKDDDGKEYIDVEATERYRQSLGQLRESWDAWWKSDLDASEQLVGIYNAMFNRDVPRVFDGTRLVLPNANPAIVLRDPQKQSVVGALYRGNTLLAQTPGWGKTFEMIAIAGEWKRQGFAQKPIIVVPNHIVEQWRRDFLKFYPAARVLLPEKSDFQAGNRKRFVARVANNDWDAVVIGMSQFLRIGVKLETIKAFVNEQEAQLLAEGAAELGMTMEEFSATVDAYGEDDKKAAQAIGGRGVPRSVKDVARAILNLRKRLKKRTDQQSKDPINFEELGIDALMVDEAHLFKSLYFYTGKNNIVGLKGSDADQALDLYLKVRHINQTSNNRNVVFATGTPITNVMSEIYTVFRYLAQAQLDRLGMAGFDAWANAYATAVGTMEPRPEGGYKERTRLSEWSNLQELSAMFRRFADVATREDVLKENARLIALGEKPLLKLPKEHKVVVELEPHPEAEDFYRDLKARIEALKTGKVNPKDDNHLKITTEASLAAVDMRLVRAHAVDDPGGRLRAVAREVEKRYRASMAGKGTQLIFLDVGVPKGDEIPPLPAGLAAKGETEDLDPELEVEADDNVVSEADREAEAEAELDQIRGLSTGKNLYAELKRLLIARGIPEHEIAFVHSAKGPSEQNRLFEAMREGRVRVMLSTRAKGATGMNVQDRGVAVHHVDVPWRPDQIEQADARFIRDGNMNSDVDIVRYVTKKSFDEYRWFQLAKKQGFISGFYRGTIGSMEDVDLTQEDMQVASAIASGDPRTLQMVQTERALVGLRARAENFRRRHAQAGRELDAATHRVKRLEADLAEADGLDTKLKAWAENPTVVLDKKVSRYGGLEDAPAQTYQFKDTEDRKRLKEALAKIVSVETYSKGPVGHAGPFILERHSITHPPIHTVNAKGEREVTQGYEAGMLVVTVPLGKRVLTVGSTPEWDAAKPPDLVRSLDNKLDPTFAEQFKTLTGHQLDDAREDVDGYKQIVEKRFEQEDQLTAKEAELRELRLALGIERAEAAAPTRDDEGEIRTRPGGPDDEGEGTESDRAPSTTRRGGGGGEEEASEGDYLETTPTASTAGHRPIEFPELVELARELIRTPSVVRGFRGNPKRGTFSSGSGMIRLHADLFKAGMEQQLARTLAHEIGHLIDWLPHHTLKRGNLLGRLQSLRGFLKHTFTAPDGTTIKNKVLAAELGALSDKWRPWKPDEVPESFAKYRRSSRERYADALSVLLNDPGMLQREAPIFYKQFFDALNKKPEVKAKYEELQTLFAGTPEERTAHRRAGVRESYRQADVAALGHEREKVKERAEVATKDWYLRLRQQLVDKNTPVKDRMQALAARGVHINPDDDPRYMFEERNYLGGKLKSFLERHFQPIYEDLREAGIDWTTFGEMLMYERIAAGDRSEIANPRGIQPKVAEELAADVRQKQTPAQNQVLDQSLKAFRAAVAGVMEEAHDVGLYTDKLYEQMKDNPAYATYRVVDYLDREVSSRVYRQIGTLKDIQNPADATMAKTLATIKAIEQQKMKLALFDVLHQHFTDDIEQAREHPDRGVQPPPDRRKQDVIYYWEKGRLRGKYVDPYIAHSVNNTAVGHDWAALTALKWMNSHAYRPLFTSLNLGFQSFNFYRDFLRTWKNVPGMTLGRLLKRYRQAHQLARARAFGVPARGGTAAQQAAREDLLQAQEAGAFSITLNDMNKGRHVEDSVIEDTLAKFTVGDYASGPLPPHGVRQLKAMLKWIEDVGNYIETLPKAAALYEYRKTGEIKDLPADVRSHIRNKVGSPDFLAGGTLKPVTNDLFLFSNAIVQAIWADLDMAFGTQTDAVRAGGGAGQPPVPPGAPPVAGAAAPPPPRGPWTRAGWWYKTAKLNVAPKLLAAAVLYLLAKQAAKDPKGWIAWLHRLYRGMSEYDLTNYLVVPVGFDYKGNVIYFRWPQDDIGRFFGGITWKALRLAGGDKDVWQTAAQVLDYTAGQMPGLTPTLGAAVDTYKMISGQNIYDDFRNRMLFKDDEQAARDWHTWKKFFGYEFNNLGASILYKFTAGEPRPRERTASQVILDLPIISNTVGRWIKITNLGELEKLRAAQGVVKQTEARERLTETDEINDALTQLQKLPPDQRAGKVDELAHAIVVRLHPDASEQLRGLDVNDPAVTDPDRVPPPGEKGKRQQQYVNIRKKINMGALRGTGEALTEAVLSAPTNEQKVAALVEAAKGMTETDLQTWLLRAGQHKVISKNVRTAFQRARPQPAAAAAQ